MAKKGELTPKQKRFVEVYCECFNASEAARQAGYKGRSDSQGPRLLGNVGISAAIAKRMAEVSEKSMITTEFVHKELKRQYDDTADSEQRQHPIKCLDLMTKILGMQQTNVKHEGITSVTVANGVPRADEKVD